MKKILLFLAFIPFFLFSQNVQVDSLSTLLKTTKDNYEIALINLQLAKLHERIDLKKGKEYAYKAYKFSGNDSLLAEINNQLGRFHFLTAQLDSASHYFENTKSLLKKQNDEKRIAVVNISLGAIQLRQGNYEQTITTLTESARFFEDTKDDLNAAKCYSNIASAFAELDNYTKAIEYSEKALDLFNRLNQTQFQLITLPNLATQHFKNGDTLKAIRYNSEAEKLATELDNKRSLSLIYNNLGTLYLDSDTKKAKAYLEKTLELKNALNLRSGIEITESNLGYVHLKNGDYHMAISYLKKAASVVKGRQLVFVYNNLKEAYQKLNNTKEALKFSEKSKKLNDSLLSVKNQETILNIQTKYETEKK